MSDRSRQIVFSLALAAALASAGARADNRPPAASPVQAILATQPKVAKIYGAGGPRGMEAYQSGLLISPEGHLLTAWSAVLDTDYLTVTLSDGRKLEGKLLGADPRLEVAVVKIDAAGLDCFDLSQAVEVDSGTRADTT